MHGDAPRSETPLSEHLDRGQRDRAADPRALEARLEAMLGVARAAWPGIELPPSAFVAHLAARARPEADPTESIAELRAPELYLACACGRGDPRAIAGFEAAYLGDIRHWLRRIDASPAFADEVKQLVRQKLFVGPDAKIADYSGRGELRAWVRVTATRVALSLVRARKNESELPDDSGDLAAPGFDPELDRLRTVYQVQFREAFEQAVARLEPRARLVLRYHLVDRLSIDEIGALQRVHRVTASRWINDARAELVAETRKVLEERLRVRPAELDSILRLVRSQVDLSVERILRQVPE